MKPGIIIPPFQTKDDFDIFKKAEQINQLLKFITEDIFPLQNNCTRSQSVTSTRETYKDSALRPVKAHKILCIYEKEPIRDEHIIKNAVMDFVTNYGLLGFMTALPTTPSFMDYEAVYLPKNHFIKSETMTTQNYLDIFYPFQKIDVRKKGIESAWNVYEDKNMLALMMTFADQPQAMNMSFQREYAERYDWILLQFKDWAFTLATSEMYYSNDKLDEETKMIYKQAISAFGGIALTYHISFYDKPTIVWDFHSLLLGIQLMFSMILTDDTTHLKLCKNCMSAFIANRANVAFCCSECKDNYNVRKNRNK